MYDRLITHAGTFHADDVFAAATLRTLAPEGAPLVRTRDPELLAQAVQDPRVAVWDVGDHWAPERGCFDHHQRGFARVRDNGVPFAAFGLVWEAHGLDYVRTILGGAATQAQVEAVCAQVERALVWSIDAADHAQLVVTGALRDDPALALEVLDISSLVALYLPAPPARADGLDAAFDAACQMARAVLSGHTQRAFARLLAAEAVVAADDGGPLLVLDPPVLWRGHAKDHHRFVISPASSGEGWVVEAVQDAFVSRCPLPVAWAGLRDEALSQASGVDGAIFCHLARFIAAARTREGAIALAHAALRDASSP